MNELAAAIREMTLGGWGIWTGVMMFAGWWLREWRETRKLSSDDRQARREGYQKQVEQLTSENRALQGDLARLRTEYDAYRRLCHIENDQLRDTVQALDTQVEGLKRQFAAQGIEVARHVPLAAESIERVSVIARGRRSAAHDADQDLIDKLDKETGDDGTG